VSAPEKLSPIDTHIHLWDPTRPEGIDWPNSDYPRINEPLLPSHFLEVAQRNGLRGAIVVEASDRLRDNQWLLDLVKPDADFFLGVVGNLAMGTADFAENLETLSQDARYLGIRIRNLPEGEVTEAVVADLNLLAEKDLSLDLLIRNVTLEQAATIAEKLPDLRIILNHVCGAHHEGKPMSDEWVAGVQRVAQHSNVFCKISGLFEHAWEIPAPKDPSHYKPALSVVWDAFGEDRIVFGSNWPVTRHGEGTYQELRNILDAFFADKEDAVHAKLYWENAIQFYRLK